MTHACPGGCGTQIVRTRLACQACWYRLPKPLRDDVNGAYRRRTNGMPGGTADHRAAIMAAAQWYRANPLNPTDESEPHHAP